MKDGPWSLRARLTRYGVLGTVAIVVVCAGFSAWFLRGAVEREVDALVNEELEEMTVKFVAGVPEPDRLEEIARELAAAHPENPMGWRVLSSDGSAWLEVGPEHLLRAARAPGDPETPLVRATRGLDGDRSVTLVLDASPQYAALQRYGGVSLALVGAFGLVAALGGALFARSVALQLESIAEWIRARADDPLSAPSDRPGQQGAPEEVHRISGALVDLLRKVHAERERASLLMMGMAHELRSPVQNLLGQTEIALLRERSGEEYREVLTSQLEELRRFGRVVDNLVTLCASEQGDSRASRETFDLGEEARLRLASEIERARRSGVELAADFEGDLAYEGDREALLLALGNLVGNAIDWSGPDGRTAVRLVGTADALTITVDDTGPGVPAPEREHIFEPFYHGPSPDGARLGFGLGLALARAAVDAHGGSLVVGDAPLGGARFEARLPRHRGRRNGRGERSGDPAGAQSL